MYDLPVTLLTLNENKTILLTTVLWWPFTVFSPKENGKHMLSWVRSGGGCGGLAQNTVMLVARQECLRLATLAKELQKDMQGISTNKWGNHAIS